MKTLYIDCGMGAAGDMFSAALIDLLSEGEKEEFLNKIKALNIPGVSYEITKTEKCGITGSHVKVLVNGIEEESHDDHDYHHDHDHHHDHEHSHHHTFYKDICAIVDAFPVSDKVKGDIQAIYLNIAKAEGKVHGKEISDIHFHEVGSLDAVTDIAATCILMEMIGADKVYASPVHVGSGKVKCAHGILPVPAPATAEILKDIPIYGGRIQGELCTPTGAAILKHFVSEFGNMPPMAVSQIGYGMGNKDFEIANCIRMFLSDTPASQDEILDLSFNVDDMTGEEIGFAIEVLMENGARDVFAVPVTMKKSRPGHWIHVLCMPEDKELMVSLIMKHTTTIGIRESISHRNVLDRKMKTLDTECGSVRIKCSSGYGTGKEKAEFEDIAGIAREKGMSLYEVKKLISSL